MKEPDKLIQQTHQMITDTRCFILFLEQKRWKTNLRIEQARKLLEERKRLLGESWASRTPQDQQ